MVCDALFTDYDNDGWQDLVLAGEWMPITFLHNVNGFFKNETASSGVAGQTGWWSSLVSGDFDNDGDMDYIAGNVGLNSFYRASPSRPVSIRAKDFDDNKSYDAIPSLFLPATVDEQAEWHEFPAYGRDDMIKQILSTRVRYQNYQQFALATIDSILPSAKIKGAQKLSVNFLASAILLNNGNGKFSIKNLPYQAQFAPVCGMVSGDFDNDGNLDCLISANDFGIEPVMGRYDAMNGLLLKGDGKGGFLPLTNLQSGIFIGGDARGLVKLRRSNEYVLAATQNKGELLIFKNKHVIKMIKPQADDVSVIITLANGKKQRMELYYGSSFLSQNSRFFEIPGNIQSCIVTNSKGVSRTCKFDDGGRSK